MNIAFAKIGKSIKFKTNNYSKIGGDNEPSCLLRILANHNPDMTFYIVGRSDYETLKSYERREIFKYDNVVDVWAGVKLDMSERYYNHIINYFKQNNIKIDFAVMMVGQLTQVTIPDRILTIRDKPPRIAKVMAMSKWYSTPISLWLNECKPRYVEIVNDPRYTMRQSRDIFHLPENSLGQYDYTYTTNPIKSYEDQEKKLIGINVTYSGMETLFCHDYNYEESINTEGRNCNFSIVLNQGKPSRFDMLNEWVLSNFDDVAVYGKWDDEIVKSDMRFKGPIHIHEIQKKLRNVKSTFIIPIRKGWVTSKYIEMIHAGVIPFFHPTYDEQAHIDVPEYVRVTTPNQLKDRVLEISESHERYVEIISDLRSRVLKLEYYDGTFINGKVMSSMIDNYMPPQNFKEPSPIMNLERLFG